MTLLLAGYAFLLTMSVPVYIRTFLSGELAAISMVLLGLALGAAFTLGAHAANRRERLGFALRLRNAELIGDIDLARAAAESGRRDSETINCAALDEFAAAQRLSGCGSWSWYNAEERMSWSDEFFRLIGLPPQSCPPGIAGWLEQVHAEDHDRDASVGELGLFCLGIGSRLAQPGDHCQQRCADRPRYS